MTSNAYQNSIKRQSKLNYRINKLFKNYGKAFLYGFGAVAFFALLSVLLMPRDTGWLNALVKPKSYPPNFVFGLAWTILYLLLAIGLTFTLKASPKKRALILYSVIGFLNLLWIVVFFHFKSLTFGAIILATIVVLTYFLLIELYKISKISFYFTLPYMIWILFAFWLNYSIYFLN